MNARSLLEEMMDDLDPDTAQAALQARQQTRAGKVPQHIAYAFRRAGIELNPDERIEFDAETREAAVHTENHEILASQVATLMKSGLADDYRISAARSYGLRIDFTVHPSLDAVV